MNRAPGSRVEPVRVLVAIAHHGQKNRAFLDQMLREFSGMHDTVDVVILAEAPKTDLPDDVEVRIGLPTSDPWSLPFGHRQLFAERVDDYDVFIYSEDDTLIEQRHLDTFLELSAALPNDALPGWQRYELHPDGRRSYCTVHSHYHWDTRSIRRHGDLTIARFTNDHGAAYALTRAQLRRAIGSGGFLVAPHRGRYDMLVSAATDVYTQCGMTKVFCIERMDDQLVHHLPNVYLDSLGVGQRTFDVQLESIAQIADGERVPMTLFDTAVDLPTDMWDRHAFPVPLGSLVDLLPANTARLLSVGTASGSVEQTAVAAGVDVVGIPIDEVLAAVATERGIATWAPEIPSNSGRAGDPFDVIVAFDVLAHVSDPVEMLRRLAPLLADGGQLIVTVPDHSRYRLRNIVRRRADRVPVPRSHQRDRMHRTGRRWLRRVLGAAGFEVISIEERWASRRDPIGRRDRLTPITGNTVLARARSKVETS